MHADVNTNQANKQKFIQISYLNAKKTKTVTNNIHMHKRARCLCTRNIIQRYIYIDAQVK